MLKATLKKRRALGKVAFAALLALTFCMAHPASTAYAKKRKLAKYGSIKILSTPGGLPIEIDGKPEGETTTDYRSFDRDPGLHTVVITLPSGQRWTREIDLVAGRIKCVAINFRASPPVVKSPCPYPVSLSVDAEVNEGDVITFSTDTAYSGTEALNYTWSLSPAGAKIQTSVGNRITVDSTGLGGQRITATVVVDDGSGEPACKQTAQASTFVKPPTPHESPSRQFDVCCSCSFDDQKARLDNLAVELQNDPSTTTYVIAYGGRTSRIGQADLLGTRARDYLTAQRGIDQSRITVINGGFREEDCVELWIVPRGATPPQPTPTVQAGDVRPAPVRTPRRRRGRD
ncbi:MAG TPA: hypothetical protein VGN90_16550 [Pyrinomonadaceae bacterium]|jgi:hypothetical protein|nr:hypothetical protein [Pyrinomonadaceae bacterium]